MNDSLTSNEVVNRLRGRIRGTSIDVRDYFHADRDQTGPTFLEDILRVCSDIEAMQAMLDHKQQMYLAALRGAVETPAGHTHQKLLEFFSKYAIGGKMKPSCLVCGAQEFPPGITHAELPDITVCFSCRDAGQAARAASKTSGSSS